MNRQLEAFKNFIERIEKCDTIHEILKRAEKSYQIKSYEISQISPVYAYKLFDSIHQKFYKKDNHHMSSSWFENQLRLFIWCIFCYAHLKNVQVLALVSSTMMQGREDWQYFSTIFNHKDPKLFEYQCHCLYMDNKGKNWQLEEQHLLKKIMEENLSVGIKDCSTKIKWHEISKELFQVSQKKYLRSPKQCRERWNNHLDPEKIKGMWKRQECLLMFEYVKEHGKKWANIVKCLKNTRNEHSIKNKFNSLLKKQQKINKNLTEQEMYIQIIARIKSAIANDFRDKNNSDFDIEDDSQILNKRKQNCEKKKAENFPEKFMQKLLVFGNNNELQVTKQNKKKKMELTKIQNKQKTQLLKVPLITNLSTSNRQDEQHKVEININESQQIYQDRLNELNRFEEQHNTLSQINKENSSLDDKWNELSQQFHGPMFKEYKNYEVQILPGGDVPNH